MSRDSKVKVISFMIIAVFLLINVLVIRGVVVKIKTNRENTRTYNAAIEEYNSGVENLDLDLLDNAYDKFSTIYNFKDSQDYMNRIGKEKDCMHAYKLATQFYDSGDYVNAMIEFSQLERYRDSEALVNNIADDLYIKARTILNEKNYSEAERLLVDIPETAIVYIKAQSLLSEIDEQKRKDIAETVVLNNNDDSQNAETTETVASKDEQKESKKLDLKKRIADKYGINLAVNEDIWGNLYVNSFWITDGSSKKVYLNENYDSLKIKYALSGEYHDLYNAPISLSIYADDDLVYEAIVDEEFQAKEEVIEIHNAKKIELVVGECSSELEVADIIIAELSCFNNE